MNLFRSIKGRNKRNACVLLYHRIGKADTDVWQLAVTPEHFEKQLQVISCEFNVLSAHDLLQGNLSAKKNNLVLTFDDGYLDNYTIAKPLLGQYGIPATFFITADQLRTPAVYWWDELEYILLQADLLPGHLKVTVQDQPISFQAGEEAIMTTALRQAHATWDAMEAPVSRRAALYFQLWKILRSLTSEEQQSVLQQLRSWMITAPPDHVSFHCISAKQLVQLAGHPLFTIGSHTCSHPALAELPSHAKQQELVQSKQWLEGIINKDIDLLAYPYGNYDQECVEIARRAGYGAAFCTEPAPFQPATERFSIGRFVVKNTSERFFRRNLAAWFKI